MEDGENERVSYHDSMLKLPLYSSVIKEFIWLKRVTTSKKFLKKTIEDPQLLKDFSILKTIRTDEDTSSVKENIQLRKKAQTNLDRQLKLYEDLQWSRVPGYFLPVHSGDYSPLSPDGEFVERHGRLGLDFWQWNRETSPLGYVPPLCTCKRTEDCITSIKKWNNNMKLDYQHRVCDNDVCRGMLYIPYSLLEIPLNRAISNGSEFALKVKVPNETDVYCGNMKHTIILCTTSRRHEKKCLQAIELSEVSSPLIYDVECEDFIPYFKKYNEYEEESPLMTVEPIDSEVSDSEQNFGLGQMFAIRKMNQHVMFEKYDPNTKNTSPIDNELIETWDRMCNMTSPCDSQDLSTEVSDPVTIDNSKKQPNEDLEVEIDLKTEVKNSLNDKTGTSSGRSGSNKHRSSQNTHRSIGKPERTNGKAQVKRELKGDVADTSRDKMDQFSDDSDEMGLNKEEDLEKVRDELKNQKYKLYILIESFSSDRRPLMLTLRSGKRSEETRKRSNQAITLEDPNKPKKSIKVTPKEMQSLHLLNAI